MSLVAYVASDDDDSDSDSGPGEVSLPTPQAGSTTASGNNTKNLPASALQATSSSKIDADLPEESGHISDEDDYQPVSVSTLGKRSHGQEALDSVSSTSSSDTFVRQLNGGKTTGGESEKVASLDVLPAPQKNNAVLEEGDLEDEVKPKEYEIANAPKPPPKKTRQPVRITIPSLEETGEDESQSTKKMVSASTKKCGLFSLLPAPIHSAKKEINRQLIPHSLGRKAPAATKTPVTKSQTAPQSSNNSTISSEKPEELSSKRLTQFNALTGYDSDSDEDTEAQSSSANFFSIDSSSKSLSSSTASTSVPLSSFQVSAAASNTKNVQSQEVSSSDSSVPRGDVNPYSSSSIETEAPEEVTTEPDPGPEPGMMNDTPLDFGVGRPGLSHWGLQGSHSYLSPVGQSGPVPSYSGASASAMYNMANYEGVESSGDPSGSDDFQQLMNDKEFQRFHGKRKRGMPEEISFVDANVDDYVDPSEVSKHLTEETEYSSQKSKDNLPTSQQKRKKQITYLAHQAKERELELKNQWAQNRHTKKQTQSKYGF